MPGPLKRNASLNPAKFQSQFRDENVKDGYNPFV